MACSCFLVPNSVKLSTKNGFKKINPLTGLNKSLFGNLSWDDSRKDFGNSI